MNLIWASKAWAGVPAAISINSCPAPRPRPALGGFPTKAPAGRPRTAAASSLKARGAFPEAPRFAGRLSRVHDAETPWVASSPLDTPPKALASTPRHLLVTGRRTAPSTVSRTLPRTAEAR